MKKLKLLSLVLAMVMSVSVFTSCGGTSESTPDKAETYTYKTYTSVSPSNWNELTYQDNNDTQIMSYIGSPLFEFDFKFDDNGDILPGEFEVEYSFATALNDVSDQYGYPEGSAMAWEIEIRDDGKWEDGTPIVAGDFVYTAEQLLDPDFKNYRADTMYAGATIIKNARNFVYQGSESDMEDNNVVGFVSSVEDLTKDANGIYNFKGMTSKFAIGANSDWCGGDASLASYKGKGYLNDDALAQLEELMDADGYVDITDETIAILIETISTPEWNEDASNVPCYIHFFDVIYPEMTFDEVGFKAPDDTHIHLILEQSLNLLKEDGSLAYNAAYNMASLPLVKKDLYEACKQAPVEGSELWTSNYNSSLETTASWGPYKLVEFQAGKIYKMEKNEHWYGWNMEKYEGQYQTTHIECETIDEYNTAFMKFLKGDLSGIGIDVSVADEYKGSAQAYFTPDDYVGSLQLQSSKDALAGRQSEGINKTILSYTEFRKALSLAIDRDTYAKKTTTSSLKGLGIFNSMHYYDVENGGAYRNTDAAKLVLCETYGVDPADYASLDEAVAAISGYDLAQAKELVTAAYNAALEAGDISANDKVVLTYGSSVDNEVTRRYFNELSAMWTELMKGTPLEGRFELEFNASFASNWANDFRAGAYDVCQGGWTGAAWDPGYLLMAYLDPSLAYSAAWNTKSAEESMTFTLHGVNANGVPTNNAEDTFTATMPLYNWWYYLNTNWKTGNLDQNFRVELIAALEGQVLTHYFTVPVTYSFGASLISYQVDYITYEYNTFMGYGGIQYMTYNYSDSEWAAWVAENSENGEINYK